MTQLFDEDDEDETQPQFRVNPDYAARLQVRRPQHPLFRSVRIAISGTAA